MSFGNEEATLIAACLAAAASIYNVVRGGMATNAGYRMTRIEEVRILLAELISRMIYRNGVLLYKPAVGGERVSVDIERERYKSVAQEIEEYLNRLRLYLDFSSRSHVELFESIKLLNQYGIDNMNKVGAKDTISETRELETQVWSKAAKVLQEELSLVRRKTSGQFWARRLQS